MKPTRLLQVILLPLVILAAGCSSGNIQPLVSRDSSVSRDNALVVVGVSFYEMYNDTQDERTKKLFSADLLKDKERVFDKLDEKDGTVLDERLYYLTNFRYQFESSGGNEYQIVHFGTDTREYEPIAIHEFKPGSMRLVRIVTDQFRFQEKLHFRDEFIEWKKFRVDYEENFGSWELEPGKITYMGHLTMYFKTERFVLGLLMPRERVSTIDLVAVVIEDRFEETKQQLRETKPWFPVSEMVNQSQPGKWVYDEGAFAKFADAPATDTEKDRKREIKRDIKKYFF